MKNVKIVVVDVGAVNVGPMVSSLSPHSAYKAMEAWTASEKLTYGPAFASIFREVQPQSPSTSIWSRFMFIIGGRHTWLGRRGTGAEEFVQTLVELVNDQRDGSTFFGLRSVYRSLQIWFGSKRIPVGAGANTYRMASYLPPFILDTVLLIPHFLISIRNTLLPLQSQDISVHPGPAAAPLTGSALIASESEDSGLALSETGSDADVESNPAEGGVDESWVSLKK